MKKGALLITSFLAIALSVALIVGSTFALFSEESRVNISLNSGEVHIEAFVENFELYSAQPDANGTITDKDGEKYSYKSVSDFTNGGTGSIANDGSIAFENMSAGDKAEFDINLKNNSTMRVLYNTRITLVGQDSNRLFDVLNVTATPYGSSARTLENYVYDGNAIRTDWTPLLTGADGKVKITIEMPVDADKTAQGLSVKLLCSIAAIQANKDVNGIALVTDESGEEHDCITMAEVMRYAPNGSTVELVRGDDGSYKDKYGIVDVDKEIEICSADGESYRFTDLAFNLVEGGSLTLRNLSLYGDSYVNATNASAVTVDNCTVKATPSVLFDEYNRQPLDRAAFVVAIGYEQSGKLVTVTDSTFDMGEGCAAVFFDAAVGDGSLISGNTFGVSGSSYNDYAVVINSVVRNAEITLKDNVFYGAKGATFAQKYLGSDTAFAVRLLGNEMTYGGEGNAALANTAAIPVELTDSGSTVNGAMIGLDNLTGENTLFCGINVTRGRDGLLSGGEFKVNGEDLKAEDYSEFFNRYVSYGYNRSDFKFN